ncbi:MAG: hypothetical protein WCG23_09165, partial [bacterium]
MRLTVLVDNNTYTDSYFYGEPALCFYIEENNRKILFDTGYSDIFIKNAKKIYHAPMSSQNFFKLLSY